jgi:hypothetical protein
VHIGESDLLIPYRFCAPHLPLTIWPPSAAACRGVQAHHSLRSTLQGTVPHEEG